MALLDIFKKKDKKEEKIQTPQEAPRPQKARIAAPAKKGGAQKKATHNVAAYLLQAHITEKASRLAEKENQYVFQITPRANKNEVKKAVESYYNVDVTGVNIAKIPGKRHRRAKSISQDSDLRKAIVKIKEGQKIELLPR